eukprot:6846727-Pyramimonas_sp.AAC.1
MFVGMSQAVWPFLFQHVSFSEQFARMSQAIRWFEHLKGGGGEGISLGPFRGFVWGCLRRFGNLLFQHVSLSGQIWRMSQAIR